MGEINMYTNGYLQDTEHMELIIEGGDISSWGGQVSREVIC